VDGTIRHDAGITLIELLIVMTILAVLAVGVMLVPLNHGTTATTRDSDRLRQQLASLQDLALYQRAPMGLDMSSRQMQTVAWRAGDWQPQGKAIRWSGNVRFTAAAPRGIDTPDIVVLPDQRYTPFQIRMGQVQCSGDGWGPVTCAD